MARGCSVLPQVSNTMGQAWLTLTQARAVLTKARNALVEATFVADVTWSRWARRGAWRCKWWWEVGLRGRGGSAFQSKVKISRKAE
jgi:hypothetical protein